MNPLEYLLFGFLVVMAIGTWFFINAIRHAEDGFQSEQGFQLGIAPPVHSLYPLPAYTPTPPPRAVVPEIIPEKSSRPARSKPPMLPVNLTVSDLNPSTERKSRRPRNQTDTSRQDTQPPFPSPVDTPKKQ